MNKYEFNVSLLFTILPPPIWVPIAIGKPVLETFEGAIVAPYSLYVIFN